MLSIFTDPTHVPTLSDLQSALGSAFPHWQTLADHTKTCYPAATETWKYGGVKYGWSFQISDKKRVLLYLLPRDGFFKAAFVLGAKATDKVMESDISVKIKSELMAARVYAEGRGIRIEVRDAALVPDLQKIIAIKIGN